MKTLSVYLWAHIPSSAFIQTLDYLKKNKVINKNWSYGSKIISERIKITKKISINECFYFSGIACSQLFNCLDKKKNTFLDFRTLFIQEMLKEKILMLWASISFRHNKNTLKKTLLALEKTLFVYRKALEQGVKKYINERIIKPVFGSFN